MDRPMRLAKLLLAFSASFLMIAMAAHLLNLPRAVHAETQVDPLGGIVAVQVNWDPSSGYEGWNGNILLADGQVYEYGPPCTREGVSYSPYRGPAIPVPVSELKYWGLRTLVTLNDEVWVMQPSGSPCGSTEWVNLGQPPNLPVSAAGESTSTLKRRY